MMIYDCNCNVIIIGSCVMVSGIGYIGKILLIDTEGLIVE